MRVTWKSAVVLCLPLAACGAEVAALGLGLGLGLGVGYIYDEYYDDCHDDHHDDHHHYDDCYYYAHVGWAPATVAADDVDGDGVPDLVVGDLARPVVWSVRRGTTGFEAPQETLTLAGLPSHLSVLDVDGDGVSDLWVLDDGTGRIETFTGGAPAAGADGVCALGEATTRFARGPIDGDDLCDAVTVDDTGALRVALGQPGGALRVLVGRNPMAGWGGDVQVALGDLDDTPGTDLLVVDGAHSRLAVFSGHGDGTFDLPKTVTFDPLGSVLSVALVTLEAGARPQVAVLFGDAADLSGATSTLAVVRTANGSLAVAAQPLAGARSITSIEPVAGGPSLLLVADPVHGSIRTLHLRKL